MMKKFLFFIFYFLIASAYADMTDLELENSKYIPLENAVVQVMNKQAGKVQLVEIPVGKNVKFDKLDVLVRKCLGVDEFLPEDYFMFAEIAHGGKKVFSSWMTKNEPGQNPLQDPDYDLWLVRCE
jgi:hypothetical protein